MKIYLNEDKLKNIASFCIIEALNNASTNQISNKKIELVDELLEKLLKNNGIVLTNIENGKDYLTYELLSFIDIIGKRCCLCRLIKNGKQYGAIMIKPLDNFKRKI